MEPEAEPEGDVEGPEGGGGGGGREACGRSFIMGQFWGKCEEKCDWLREHLFLIQALSDFVTAIGQGPNSHKIRQVAKSYKATV